MNKHILSVRSQNAPGVLSRISGLLRRKLFNIDSLAVGRTSNPKVSRFTIVIVGEESEARKAAGVIERLVEVLSVKIIPYHNSFKREIVLARIKPKNEKERALLREIEGDILVKEIQQKGDEIVLELVDKSQTLETFLEKILESRIEVIDWVRSGIIALEK